MAAVEDRRYDGRRQDESRSRSWPSATCGCTSRAWARYDEREVPIIVRGEGCYVYDEHGNALPRRARRAVLREHRPRPRRRRPGRRRPGARSSASSRTGPTRTRRRSSSPRASPRSRPATSTASSSPPAAREAVDSALKLCRQYHKLTGNPGRYKVDLAQARLPRHDDGRAHRDRHPRRAARRSSRCSPAPRTCRTRTPTGPEVDDPAEAIRERILFEGPETVVVRDPRAGAELRRLLRRRPTATSSACARSATSSGSCFISDEVICSWGRLGEYFGAERFGYQPDIITTAKGLTSVLRADGRRDRLRPGRSSRSPHGAQLVRARHHVRRPPGGLRGRARQPRRVRATRALLEQRARARGRVPGDARLAARHPDRRRRARDGLLLGDRAGHGPGDQGDASPSEEGEWLLRGFLSAEMFSRGLICRADDRGDPVDPALAAADRRARSSSRRSSRCCGPCSRRPSRAAAARREPAHADRSRDLIRGPRRPPRRRRGGRSTAPVRWVHISELADPTPWLSGGELLLTTGHAARRRRTRSARTSSGSPATGSPGLGLGTGFAHDERARRRCVEAADELGFPLFEVPYEVPFIAVTEKAFTHLVNEQYAVLQRALSAHERLERIVLSERGLDGVAGALAVADRRRRR